MTLRNQFKINIQLGSVWSCVGNSGFETRNLRLRLYALGPAARTRGSLVVPSFGAGTRRSRLRNKLAQRTAGSAQYRGYIAKLLIAHHEALTKRRALLANHQGREAIAQLGCDNLIMKKASRQGIELLAGGDETGVVINKHRI